ncbi:HAD family hydrolase [Corallococcus llansteffanensis]|uniref:Haloacid dehalogenase-like hydrolase n=1 Tax=Corallococcus llansteffanensis TaxID=2316731 RepID=A0A3A8N732_9BACT|nr:HAD family hydrolase [Corallococcus llansteffanensis]RKH40237.1 haloacid dehalogenase-like hydrolase [Corallococcus llansteffanensis]
MSLSQLSRRPSRQALFVVLSLVLGLAFPSAARAQAAKADPLPSWNDGPVKQAIVGFVSRVTTEGGPDFLPVEERVAVFDNDGTLWQEKPAVQGAFLVERVRALADKDPSLRKKQPYKAVLEGNVDALMEGGEKGLMELFAATHANMTQEQFQADVREFLETARHPKLGVPYTQLAYLPMLELLQYLRNNGFQTWISSGGGIDFMRVFSEQVYGIAPQQVIGSSLAEKYEKRGGKDVLWREPRVDHVNDKEGKPVGNDLHIGRSPVFVAGNVRSGGDIAMLGASRQRRGPSFQLLIHHDDAAREFAYEEKDGASLRAAKEGGWTVVSMRDDWKTVFSGTP